MPMSKALNESKSTPEVKMLNLIRNKTNGPTNVSTEEMCNTSAMRCEGNL